jgi:hypothetical protein
MYGYVVDKLERRGPVKPVNGNAVLNQFHPFLHVYFAAFLIMKLPPDVFSLFLKRVYLLLMSESIFLNKLSGTFP